jgi:hypothetical protein
VSFVDPFGLSKCVLIDSSNPDELLACLFEETFGGIFDPEISQSKNIPNSIVEEARKHVGSSEWRFYKTMGILCHFPNPSNKCNKFVYDVLTEAGIYIPLIRGRINQCPPTASDWGYPNVIIEGGDRGVVLPNPEMLLL